MIFIALVISTLVFVKIFQRLQVSAEVRRAVAIAIDASAIVRSTNLSDDDKQKAIQKAAVASFGSLLSLLLRVGLAGFGATVVVALGVVGKLYTMQDVIDSAYDWTSVLAVSLAALAAWFFWR